MSRTPRCVLQSIPPRRLTGAVLVSNGERMVKNKISKQAERTPILVTGATGKTGSYVVSRLIQMGLPVRALVHRRDQRAAGLESFGANTVVADFFDMDSLRHAVEGIRRAYFCFPPADGLLEAATNFAVVAKEAGFESVVNMSQMHAREGHPSSLTRQHWLAERLLDWAGIGATHLRCTFFAEAYLIVNSLTIASERKFYLPHGDAEYAPVACEDVARVVAAVLAKPERHVGRTYTVTGQKLMTQSEVASVFGAVLGQEVEYVAVPVGDWQRTAAATGFPPFLIDHLAHAAEDCRRGLFAKVTDVVRKIGGRHPQSFEDFIRANARAFGGQSVSN